MLPFFLLRESRLLRHVVWKQGTIPRWEWQGQNPGAHLLPGQGEGLIEESLVPQ